MFVFAACGGGGGGSKDKTSTAAAGDSGGNVRVLGIWGDAELASFQAMVQPWSGTMEFSGSRDITALLTTGVEGGNPPDVAIPAEVGLFQRFAKEGKLSPLSDSPGLENAVKSNYPESFVDLGTVDGKLYGFFMKADSKATIWYNPKFFQQKGYKVPDAGSSFDDVIALSDQIKRDGRPPWSIGQEAGAGSGSRGATQSSRLCSTRRARAFTTTSCRGRRRSPMTR